MSKDNILYIYRFRAVFSVTCDKIPENRMNATLCCHRESKRIVRHNSVTEALKQHCDWC